MGIAFWNTSGKSISVNPMLVARPWIPAAMAAGIVFGAYGLSSLTPRVRAAVLQANLPSIAARLSDDPRASASTIMRDARENKAPLKPALVTEVLQQATSPDSSLGWSTLVETVNYKQRAIAWDQEKKGGFPMEAGTLFTNVTFEGERITYEGGPLNLEDVTFRACVFNVAETENGRRFLLAVAEANGRPLTIHLTGDRD